MLLFTNEQNNKNEQAFFAVVKLNCLTIMNFGSEATHCIEWVIFNNPNNNAIITQH